MPAWSSRRPRSSSSCPARASAPRGTKFSPTPTLRECQRISAEGVTSAEASTDRGCPILTPRFCGVRVGIVSVGRSMLHHHHRVRPRRQRSPRHDPHRLPAPHRARSRLRPVARLHLAHHFKPRRNLRQSAARTAYPSRVARSKGGKSRSATIPSASTRPNPASRSTVSISPGHTPTACCSTRCRASSKLTTRAEGSAEEVGRRHARNDTPPDLALAVARGATGVTPGSPPDEEK